MGAAARGTAILYVAFTFGCAIPGIRAPETSIEPDAGRCAWFGTQAGDRLYFGISSFWAVAKRRGAEAALAHVEPGLIGRFDLAREAMLPPLPIPAEAQPGGVWDVVSAGDGRLFYTAFGGESGWLDSSTGTGGLLSRDPGSNEIIALPGGGVAVSDYADAAIQFYGPDASPGRRYPIPEREGIRVAPKSLAYDPVMRTVWFNTDLFRGDEAVGHDARAIAVASGDEVARIESPELQTLFFDAAGRGYFVWARERELTLRIVEPDDARSSESGRAIVLSREFRSDIDFAQDVALGPRGEVLVTTWSGAIFVVDRERRVTRVDLPRPTPSGLFYSAALREGRVCATFCGGVQVVCGDLP